MQERTVAASDDALPQPNAAVTKNQDDALLALEEGMLQLNTLPDCGINPATIGSEFHAYE